MTARTLRTPSACAPSSMRLEPEHRRVARRQVRDRLEPGRALDRGRDHQRAHPGARGRVVVDVDEPHEARRLELAARPRAGRGSSRRAAGRAAPRRRTRPRGARAANSRLALLLAERGRRARARPRSRRDARPAGSSSIAARIAAISVGRRAAAAADHPRAEVARVRGELGEVLRRRVRVDHPAARQAREADVRQRRERPARSPASARAPSARRAGRRRGSRRSRRRRAPASRSAASRAVTPASVSASSSKVSSATIGSVETPRTRRDRVDELVEVEERLEHEQVDAAALEQRGLLGEELAGAPRSSPPRRAGRSRRR